MSLAEKIKSPAQLKRLNLARLNKLAADIRRFLVESVTETGGHLASNLGVVELTLALHYCFDSPKDKIIWDVGHQSYVHKILTGRAPLFKTLRKYGGLSGFPKPCESKHDISQTGHSSTSISTALGLAVARDLRSEKHHVIAVIGDGSMTGGLAFEGLNNAGRLDTNLIVVLNDNKMSISENVGAMSKYLNNLRTAPSYIVAKKDIKRILNCVPVIGKPVIRAIERTKSGLKRTLIDNTVFDEYGFNYIGPVNGHDLKTLIAVLKRVKKLSGPILLHVRTTKGKGYPAAEQSPDKYHGITPYETDVIDASDIRVYNTYSEVFGKAMIKEAEHNPKLIAVTAAMPQGTGLAEFARMYPDRFFDVGIAESHAVTFAAGLASGGFIPVVAVYSTFLQRAYDQILHDVCLPNLPVIFAVDRAGVVDGDGETHQGLYDLAYLSHIPNITILSPKNRFELVQMLKFAISLRSPVCVRYPKGAASGALKEFSAPIAYGKSEMLKDGNKIALIALGDMNQTAYTVTSMLEKDGYKPALFNARFAKPLDNELIEKLRKFKFIFTLESAAAKSGMGAAYAARIAEEKIPAVFFAFAYPDTFIPQGTANELKQKYNLDEKGVYEKIKEFL